MQLFNDGSSQGPDDATGAVDTRVRLVRRSDSVDPPEVVQAIGLVTRCNVPDCSTRDVLGEVGLGPVLVGQVNTFQMFWDPFRSHIEFHRNADPPVQVPYSAPVVTTQSARTWQAMAIGANCTASPRPVAEVSVTLDNIFVFFP